MWRKFFLWLIFPVGVALAILFFSIYNKPHRSVEKEDAAFNLSASALLDDFTNDEGEANATYVGKVLEVTGIVREVVRNDSTLMVVLGDPDHIAGVTCYLVPDEDDASLESGTAVTIKGICNGMLLDVVLDKAILVRKE